MSYRREQKGRAHEIVVEDEQTYDVGSEGVGQEKVDPGSQAREQEGQPRRKGPAEGRRERTGDGLVVEVVRCAFRCENGRQGLLWVCVREQQPAHDSLRRAACHRRGRIQRERQERAAAHRSPFSPGYASVTGSSNLLHGQLTRPPRADTSTHGLPSALLSLPPLPSLHSPSFTMAGYVGQSELPTSVSTWPSS